MNILRQSFSANKTSICQILSKSLKGKTTDGGSALFFKCCSKLLHFISIVKIRTIGYMGVFLPQTLRDFINTPAIYIWGWSGGAKVLGKLPGPGRPTVLITVGQGPTALGHFYSHLSFLFSFALSLGDGPI